LLAVTAVVAMVHHAVEACMMADIRTLPAARASASAFKRSAFCFLSSGLRDTDAYG
jgi:hypothetical protein